MVKSNGAVAKSTSLEDILAKYNLKTITEYEPIQRLPSGSICLDEILGGGWAVGRIAELWGEPSFGKSLMAMITIGRTVRMGRKAVLFDMENSFDKEWAKHFIDIDSENFILVQQHANTYGERILDTILALSEMDIGVMVLDSKDAISFEAEVEGQTGNSNMGVRSQRLSYFVRRISQIMGDSNTAFIFVSQVRANFGDTYNPLTTAGGWAMDHFGSISVRTNMLKQLKASVDGKDTIIGKEINLRTTKNKTYKPQLNAAVRVREFPIDEGSIWAVDSAYEVIEFGTKLGLFTNKAGEVYSGAGNIIWNGRDLGNKSAAHTALMAEPALLSEVESVIRKKLGWQ